MLPVVADAALDILAGWAWDLLIENPCGHFPRFHPRFWFQTSIGMDILSFSFDQVLILFVWNESTLYSGCALCFFVIWIISVWTLFLDHVLQSPYFPLSTWQYIKGCSFLTQPGLWFWNLMITVDLSFNIHLIFSIALNLCWPF